MGTTLRLLAKGLRFELGAVVLGALLLSAAALVVTVRLDGVGIPKHCLYRSSNGPVAIALPDNATAQAHEAACGPKRQAFYSLENGQAAPVMALMAPFPLMAGLLLGVPLVGREIEWGTAPLAWTLVRSRRKWLLARAVPLAIALGLILIVPALAAQVLQGARDPLVSPWHSFTDSGLRGSILVGRGLLTFGVAVVIGAIMGRQLPALIAAGVVTIALLMAADAGRDAAVHRLATAVSFDQTPTSGTLVVDQEIRDTEGTLHPTTEITIGANGELPDGMEIVTLVVPGTKAPLVDGTQAAVLGGLTLGLVGLTALVVDRRRAT